MSGHSGHQLCLLSKLVLFSVSVLLQPSNDIWNIRGRVCTPCNPQVEPSGCPRRWGCGKNGKGDNFLWKFETIHIFFMFSNQIELTLRLTLSIWNKKNWIYNPDKNDDKNDDKQKWWEITHSLLFFSRHSPIPFFDLLDQPRSQAVKFTHKKKGEMTHGLSWGLLLSKITKRHAEDHFFWNFEFAFFAKISSSQIGKITTIFLWKVEVSHC